MKLYGTPLSGNCYKARLALGVMGLECDHVDVDLPGGAHKQPDFLARNPRGQVPVLEDGDTCIYDSHAILVYLARKHGGSEWLPDDALGLARVTNWLSFAANEVQNGPNLLRLHFLLKMPIDVARARTTAEGVLALLDGHLEGREWLESSGPTIADCAVMPYVALLRDTDLSLDGAPNASAWVERTLGLPGAPPLPSL